MYTMKVGLEAEVLVTNDKGIVVMPPALMPHDDFPILAEIRGDAGEDMPTVVANFKAAELKLCGYLNKKQQILAATIARLPLDTYRKAIRSVNQPKGEAVRKIRNIYGTDISDFSDQIIKGGKIQGANVSCGLHVHFSCSDEQTKDITEPNYESVVLPVKIGEELGSTSICLYRKTYGEKKEKLVARANMLTKPVVEHIVREMDKEFFERFVPKKTDTTKYRQPGFFELKEYGFEYRSLPYNSDVAEALPEITSFAFKLMKDLDKWD